MHGVENMDERNSSNFTQRVADNVDHNINTLTGKDTFHGMGIISVTQPGKITSDKLVTRTQKRKKNIRSNQKQGYQDSKFSGFIK